MNTLPGRARIMAVDFGTKRLGIAVSDTLGITAQGLPTRERTRLDDDLDYLRKLASEYAVERFVVGNPLGQSGNETAMSGRVAVFADKLRKRLGCPVELWDERLTTAEAGRMLRESGISIAKRQRAVDRVAATLLLQGYLDYQAGRRVMLGSDGREYGTTSEHEPGISSECGSADSIPDRADSRHSERAARGEAKRTSK